MTDFPLWQKENWTDCKKNPLINYKSADRETSVIADPQIILPEEFDGRWHALCHGAYKENGGGYFHFISSDGISWEYVCTWDFHVGPCYIYKDRGCFLLFSTECPEDGKNGRYKADNIIMLRKSKDLVSWSEPQYIMKPELPWEREHDEECNLIQVRNPCLIKLKNGKYRLYYSAGTVFLNKCGFEEPEYISFAESNSPEGPFEKHGKPLLAPDKKLWYRNLGAGAIKVFQYGDEFLALYNSIYTDENDYQHSAINLLLSDDGISFNEAPFNPIIEPDGKGGWKNAFIYQLDMVKTGDYYRVYYNTRDYWTEAKEQICMSYIKAEDIDIKKMQE